MLKILESIINSKKEIKDIRKFNLSGHSIESLIINKLQKLNTGNIQKIRFEYNQDLLLKNEIPLPYPEDLKDNVLRKIRINEGNLFYHNYIENALNVIVCFRRFDFEKWLSYNKILKKEMLVSEIYQALLFVAKKMGWEIQPIHDAYNACVAQNFENNWYIKKFTKTSTNRKFTGNVWVEYDIDSFRTFLVIKDKQENILEKKLVHILDYEDESINPLFDTDLIFKGSVAWKNNNFILTSSKGEILGSIEYQNIEKIIIPKKYKIADENIIKVEEPKTDYKKL